MEILSFVLGMSLVVVIAVAVVAVSAFVKVKKTNKEIETIHQIMTNESERTNRTIEDVYRRIDDVEKEFFSQLDSRLDKLENKLSTIKK